MHYQKITSTDAFCSALESEQDDNLYKSNYRCPGVVWNTLVRGCDRIVATFYSVDMLKTKSSCSLARTPLHKTLAFHCLCQYIANKEEYLQGKFFAHAFVPFRRCNPLKGWTWKYWKRAKAEKNAGKLKKSVFKWKDMKKGSQRQVTSYTSGRWGTYMRNGGNGLPL